jgi:hypothetical protein
MPLIKNGEATKEANVSLNEGAQMQVHVNTSNRIGGTHKAGDRVKHLSKEEYWDRKEDRDIQRDKDMAWSGLAQAAIASPYVAQFNLENTEDGLVDLVVRITDKLLKARDARNK